MTTHPDLATAARSLSVGSAEDFEAMYAVGDWPARLYRFQVIQNDATALIVERQYAPGRRIDLTPYRVRSQPNPTP